MNLPKIIQGGMGIGVSNWKLASAVSSAGQLGVVSGLCIDQILVRRLQMGDKDGSVRDALSHFPIPQIAKRILDKFFIENGKSKNTPFLNIELHSLNMSPEREDLIVVGGFTEIFLAKKGHNGLIGVNLLEKIQTECIPLLYGCMLAGVDYVTMGAGIPREVPGILDQLSDNRIAKLNISVKNCTDPVIVSFDPKRFEINTSLKRPQFLPVISSSVLALTLAKKSTGKIDGFIVETHKAAGHNAPPRSSKELSPTGEPIYGKKDDPNIEQIKNIGLPFWLAGGYGLKGKLQEAISQGAAGVQVGTAFMLCKESGIVEDLKNKIRQSKKSVFTDPKASPTGFPFKVIDVEGTLSDPTLYEQRQRVCNLGYLREWVKNDDGKIIARCAAEPVNAYKLKGGDEENCKQSKCLCNALFANIGLESVYPNGYHELPLLTAGDTLYSEDYSFITENTSAQDVINYILNNR